MCVVWSVMCVCVSVPHLNEYRAAAAAACACRVVVVICYGALGRNGGVVGWIVSLAKHCVRCGRPMFSRPAGELVCVCSTLTICPSYVTPKPPLRSMEKGGELKGGRTHGTIAARLREPRTLFE